MRNSRYLRALGLFGWGLAATAFMPFFAFAMAARVATGKATVTFGPDYSVSYENKRP